MFSGLLQDWATMDGADTLAFAQARADWLDLAMFADVVFWVEVRSVSNPGVGNVVLTYETAPAIDDSLFQPLGAVTLVASTTPIITQVKLSSNPAVALARFVRWSLAGTAAGNWSVTFRIFAMANKGSAGSAFDPSSAPLTSWYESPGDFGGGNWPSLASAGTSGLRPDLVFHNSQPTVSTAAYNGHHVPAFDGITNDFWGTPAGSVLMSDLVTGPYGEIHILSESDGPFAAPAAAPYDDANPWSDGGGALTMGLSLSTAGATAYLYDGVSYNLTGPFTWPTGTPTRARIWWDGVNLHFEINGTAGGGTVACGNAAVLTGSLTLGTARTLWWGPGRILSFLSSDTPLGSAFDANLVAYWNAKFGLALT